MSMLGPAESAKLIERFNLHFLSGSVNRWGGAGLGPWLRGARNASFLCRGLAGGALRAAFWRRRGLRREPVPQVRPAPVPGPAHPPSLQTLDPAQHVQVPC